MPVKSQDRLIPGARVAAEGFPMSVGLSEKVGRDFLLAQLNYVDISFQSGILHLHSTWLKRLRGMTKIACCMWSTSLITYEYLSRRRFSVRPRARNFVLTMATAEKPFSQIGYVCNDVPVAILL